MEVGSGGRWMNSRDLVGVGRLGYDWMDGLIRESGLRAAGFSGFAIWGHRDANHWKWKGSERLCPWRGKTVSSVSDLRSRRHWWTFQWRCPVGTPSRWISRSAGKRSDLKFRLKDHMILLDINWSSESRGEYREWNTGGRSGTPALKGAAQGRKNPQRTCRWEGGKPGKGKVPEQEKRASQGRVGSGSTGRCWRSECVTHLKMGANCVFSTYSCLRIFCHFLVLTLNLTFLNSQSFFWCGRWPQVGQI